MQRDASAQKTDHSQRLPTLPPHDNWIRLRTLVLLRWWAIFGQISALIISQRIYDLTLDIGLCYLVIGVSVISNLFAAFLFPESKRLSEKQTLLVVLYDMLQLGALLFLTGGLNNPFSILIVGPVIVSATALSSRSTLFLGFGAILIVSILIEFYIPLRTEDGFFLQVPDIFLFGNWVAIVIAVVFLGVYSRWIVSEMHAMSEALQATQMALAREQKLTDLGGVVAAAAHELGTPLATIKLTSAELMEELSDTPELREDAELIRDQADRCRDILRSMGRAGKDDPHLRKAPLTALIEEAAEPHLDRGKTIFFEHSAAVDMPTVLRRPEVLHGLRNLIQNAVDFAQDSVWVESDWTADKITVKITDNGPGFPASVMGRIGDPFVRRRSMPGDPRRLEYEGMGLGLFIAKTLLERLGAELTFANVNDRSRAQSGKSGAVVEVMWPRARLEQTNPDSRQPLGENTLFRA